MGRIAIATTVVDRLVVRSFKTEDKAKTYAYEIAADPAYKIEVVSAGYASVDGKELNDAWIVIARRS